MKNRIAIAFLIIGTILTGYNYFNHYFSSQISAMTPYGKLSNSERVYGIGLIDSESNTELIYKQTSSTFNNGLKLVNDALDKCEFTLIFLLDFQQVNVEVKNRFEKTTKVSLNEKSSKNINFSIPNVPVGSHNLTILALPRPDTEDPDLDDVKENYFLSTQAVIVVGNQNKVNFEEVRVPVTYNSKEPSDPIFLTIEQTDKLVPKNTNKGQVNSSKIGFNAISGRHYKVLEFIDNQQVDLADTNKIYHTEPDGLITINSKMNITDNSTHSIFLVLFEYRRQVPFSNNKNTSIYFSETYKVTP
ncbi:hypothetical protein NLX71_26095 [Paenibacillus sp. MZ04-78.2]|uniref:hypothetical protein n=1 Tax=Paenibacillus sp. MZ04-78.2 TaxID=2962034 RepID=UPI0020B6990E|nr:hypothetical protein [Paenibacillus sp. MZ04-78.2]MCP3776713.1 hypothetical protein [Paenibacillus sp. MZ04-78.2]